MENYTKLSREELIAELQKFDNEREQCHHQIEELTRTKNELNESRQHFKNLFNTMVDPVVIVDGKGKFLDITEKVAQITGFKKEELIGKNFLKTDIVSAKSKKILLKNLVKRMMGFKIKPYTVDILTKEGLKIPHEVNAAKIIYKNKPADMVIFREVVAREEAKNKLIERDEYITTILNTTQAGIVVIEEDTHKIIDINPKAAEMIGAKEKKIVGQICHNFICPAEEKNCPISDLEQNIDNDERILIRADKTQIKILKTVKRSILNGRECLVESFVDISELKQTEVNLQKSQTEYKNLFEYSPISMWLEDFSEIKKKVDLLKKDGIDDVEKYLHDHPEKLLQCIQNVKVIDVNKATLTSVGAHNKQELFDNIHKVFREESRDVFIKEVGAIARGETFFRGIGINHTLNGEKRIVSVSWTVADVNGKSNYEAVHVAINDITVQKQAEKLKIRNIKLMQQKKEIEKANQLKSEFLSNMSHELRTPLNSVIALSRVLLMQSKEKLNSDELNYLEVIERNGKSLLALINDILDISKIEAGKLEVNPQKISVKSTIETICENLMPIAEGKGIKLKIDVPQNLPLLESDSERLFHILQNLASNAVKFTQKGEVIISAKTAKNKMMIEIIDDGIGIHTDDIPHLFEKFKQIDSSSTRNFEGSGLGLTIVHESLKLIGGKIEVDSKVAKGSVFKISLPLKWQFGTIKEAEFKLKKIRSDRKTILIVDDEPYMIQLIADVLEAEGYNSIAALSGREALLLAEKYKPYAITLDIVMPEIDGWEVLQKLKQNPVTSLIPVVIVSKMEDQHTGHALGAVGYVSKPVHRVNLMSEIRKINSAPHSIMVVDDDEFDRATMREIIESEQIETISADGGLKCLKLLENNKPDILVLDLMMPDLSGFGVIEKLQKNPETMKLPVIIVTAKDLTKEDKNRLNGNVASILSKDENTSVNLAAEIRRILQQLDSRKNKVLKFEAVQKIILKQLTNVLVVEDNPDNMTTIKAVLNNRYEILEAIDGEIGLELAQTKNPALILLDINLPKMDGFEVLQKLKMNEKTKNIPTIALTAMAMKGDKEKILSAGFDGYMSKPIDPVLLIEKIANRLKEK
ncbi:MAG: response regulator [Candidatus Cloacimonetes bacterium]|jgi:PAS domain S-box-containing protein|nr:response regulator [Candidatus Cloacimonadota bacterium]MBT6993736.1 response regulator [Candidatus Cloacimonadota bacterium]MBT7469778.1 response regulator [Candidatus Cloacimonadota bacterium]